MFHLKIIVVYVDLILDLRIAPRLARFVNMKPPKAAEM